MISNAGVGPEHIAGESATAVSSCCRDKHMERTCKNNNNFSLLSQGADCVWYIARTCQECSQVLSGMAQVFLRCNFKPKYTVRVHDPEELNVSDYRLQMDIPGRCKRSRSIQHFVNFHPCGLVC